MKNKAQSTASGHQIIAFGDIHGCVGAATTAIRIAEEMNCKAVFLGDYVDRGSNSIGVLETIAQARVNHPDWIFLAGNHDVMLLDLIAGKRHPEQFDERTYKESFCEYQSLESAKKREIARLLHCLETFYESSSYIFLHGGFKSSEPDIEHISRDEIVWTYDIPLKYAGKKIVRGHNPVDTLVLETNNININTKCGYGGFLTGIILDDVAGRIIDCVSISEDGTKVKKQST